MLVTTEGWTMAWTVSTSGGQNWLSCLWTFAQDSSILWATSSQLAAEQTGPATTLSVPVTINPQQLQFDVLTAVISLD